MRKKQKKMSKETFELLIEGGKAVANQTLAQKLGPAGINISQVLTQVNEKTSPFKGMKVPVKIIADLEHKTAEIEIGTPPVSELIKKELKVQKGSGTPDKLKVANISVEQVIKIAKMKRESMLVKTLKAAVKSVAGSCNSAGVLIEGKQAHEFCEAVDMGSYDTEIQQGRDELPSEKQPMLKEQLDIYNANKKKELEKAAAEQAKGAPKEVEKKEEGKEGEEKTADAKDAVKPGEKPAEKSADKKEVKKDDAKKGKK